MVGPDWDWWLPGILDQVCYLLRWVVYLSWTKRKGKRKYQLYLYVSPCKVIWIPESGKFLLVESRIQEIVAWGIQIPGNFCLWNPQSQETFACGIRNPESSALRSVVQLKKSKIPLTTGIQNTSSADKESGIQYPEFGIDSVESRIQDLWHSPSKAYH